MTVWFVSRHPGALEWVQQQGLVIDRQVEHLHAELVSQGDRVLGSLPLELAAALCERGVEVWCLCMDSRREVRGQELSSAQMAEFSCRLRRFDVRGFDMSYPGLAMSPERQNHDDEERRA